VIPDLSLAREIAAGLDANMWEIVHVDRATGSGSSHVIGYDVAHWGSSHLSVIRDTFVEPWFHPPPFETLAEMTRFCSSLNHGVLFGDRRVAHEYLVWYRRQPWSEREHQYLRFDVIQVSAVQDTS
jgi:hypothetical protein